MADSAAGLYNGANYNVAAVPGLIGNAMNFNMDLGAKVSIPAAFLSSVNNTITISLWQYGSARQPLNTSIFEGTSSGVRVLNTHVPWADNMNVFWDAGNNGGYGRINTGVTSASQYKGQWNHWVFVKDAVAGVMQIYLNGEAWYGGAWGLTRPMTGVDTFRLESMANGGNCYDGIVDEFRVANVVQSPDWIKASFLNQASNGVFNTYGTINKQMFGTLLWLQQQSRMALT